MMTFELRHLRYFLAVAEELHFTRAARRLNIAQPPLSIQIRQLETMVGATLFVRDRRTVTLTPAGAAFVDGARRTLAEAERSADAARRASRGEVQTLRVGFADSAALSVLPDIVRRFSRDYPEVRLELTEDATQAQLDAVEKERVDVALVRGPLSAKSLRTVVLLREPFIVALPAAHPLTNHRTMSLQAVAKEPIVLFPRHLAPQFHDTVVGMFRRARLSLNVVQEAAEYQTMMSLVAAGLGISIVPESVANLGRKGVVYRPLRGVIARAQVVAAFRADHGSAVLDRFLGVARDADPFSGRRNHAVPHLSR
jgi:DNA-binding transcriptional LysR family regulator